MNGALYYWLCVCVCSESALLLYVVGCIACFCNLVCVVSFAGIHVLHCSLLFVFWVGACFPRAFGPGLPKAVGDAQATIVCGEAALTAKFGEISTRVTAQQPISMELLRPFHVFSWLLTQEQKDTHSMWCNDVYKKAGGEGKAQIGPVSAAAPTKAKVNSTGSVKQNAQMVAESSMALFKRRRTT